MPDLFIIFRLDYFMCINMFSHHYPPPFPPLSSTFPTIISHNKCLHTFSGFDLRRWAIYIYIYILYVTATYKFHCNVCVCVCSCESLNNLCCLHLYTDIDECENRPCQHNGTCVDMINSFDCHCVAGYSGTACETGM